MPVTTDSRNAPEAAPESSPKAKKSTAKKPTTRKRTKAKPKVYVAKESAVVETGGKVYHLTKGVTRLRGDHPITKLKGFERILEPVDAQLHYDPKTRPAPGEVGE